MMTAITPEVMADDARAFFDYLTRTSGRSPETLQHHRVLHGRTDLTGGGGAGARPRGRGDVVSRRRPGRRG